MTDPPSVCEMTIFTMGFTKKTAREFFAKLRDAGVKRLVDIRLNNVSQLAGFTKKADLEFFCDAILGIGYEHLPVLAPTPQILQEYKQNKGDWALYEQRFTALLAERHIESEVCRETLNSACLLCSEPTPDKCHRRLVAEHLREKWGNVKVIHL